MDDWKHDHLGNQIIILSNQVKHYLHQAAEVEGISGSQSRILHYISEFSKKTEVYQKDVEEFFYLRRSTVTQMLQAMEKNGLIRRSSVARDARLKKLELTEAGQALEAQIHTRVMQMEQRLRESLTEEEITQFLSITDKLGTELTSLGAPEISVHPSPLAANASLSGQRKVGGVKRGQETIRCPAPLLPLPWERQSARLRVGNVLRN